MNSKDKRSLLSKYGLSVALVLLGAIGGYCYYRFVGCVSGACAITSNPYTTTLYGGVIGLLLGTAIAPDAGADEAKDGE